MKCRLLPCPIVDGMLEMSTETWLVNIQRGRIDEAISTGKHNTAHGEKNINVTRYDLRSNTHHKPRRNTKAYT